MDEGGIKPPRRVWTGISSSLSDNAIALLQSAHSRHKWIAVAAVFIAIFSLALNVDLKKEQSDLIAPVSFNALLPTAQEHFRFFEMRNGPVRPTEVSWSSIVFVRDNSSQVSPRIPVNEIAIDETPRFAVAQEVDRIFPSVARASVSDGYVSPYLVAQTRKDVRKNGKQEKSFWAGVEAGAGSFNPSFSGTDAIASSIDFDALADNLGQSGFVNPSSTATQNGMNEGVATSLGLDFGMKVGKRWSIESGIQYTSIQNQANASLNVVDVYVISAGGVGGGVGEGDVASNRTKEIEENFDHTLNLDNRMRFTSVPIKAGYSLVDRKLSLRLNAGLSANYFLTSRLTDPSGQLQAADQSDSYNAWSFDGLTGFEFGYSISNNFNLTLEPNYRRSITPLSESLNTRSGFMIQTGLRYTIK